MEGMGSMLPQGVWPVSSDSLCSIKGGKEREGIHAGRCEDVLVGWRILLDFLSCSSEI
jgi:hypothetical protein